MDLFEDFEFDSSDDAVKSHTLHIIKDNDVVDLTIEEIFDSDNYDSFIGITYSVTASFINKYLSDFNHLELVIGIPNERVKAGANMAAKQISAKITANLKDEPVELYQELTTKVKQKISKNKVEVLVPTAHAVHTKLYLFSNSETGDNRIILGSANLSEQAFSFESNQFESIIIFDNHQLYDLYFSYYHTNLAPILMNYFPKELQNINAKKLKKYDAASDKDIDEVILLNNEDISKIKEKSILETFETVENKIQLGIFPASIPVEMRNVTDDHQKEVRVERENKKQQNIAYSLVKESISPRSKEPKFKSNQSIKKTIRKKVHIKVHKNEVTGIPDRKIMVNSPEQRNLAKGITGIFTPNRLDKDHLHIVGEKASEIEIKGSLELLNEFIHTFEKYTVKYDETYGARIFEAILYTFTAPFLFEIKAHARSEEERNDIPQFLFLGGTAGSGKSSLLKVIARLTDQPNALDYNSIIPVGGRRKKETIDTLGDWMSETNVAPLLLDEIPVDFFSNPNYGNELIVNTANRTAYDLKAAPVLIGTTNAEGFTLEERASRRSYYLRLDKVFEELYREESQPIYNKIYDSLNSTLFNDFIVRISERLSDDDIDWVNFGETGKIDFLYHSREIFKEYYAMSNIPLPIYFPLTRYDDSKESNQEKWRKLYMGTSQDDFKFDEVSGNLLFKMSLLDENISRFGGGKPSEIYINALSQKVIVGSKDGTDIELDTPLFFEWVNMQDPFINHYQRNIQKIFKDEPGIFHEDKQKNIIAFNLNDFIKNKETVKRYHHYIPRELVIKSEKNHFTVRRDSFYKWLDMEPKKSFWNKIMSY